VLKADHQPGFHFPIFYTMWHMLASAFGCMVLMYFTPPETGYPSFKQLWEYRYVLVINSSLSTLNILLNNVSLTLISLFLNQVIKACAPSATMAFSAALQGRRYSYQTILACCMIVAGTVLAVPQKTGGGATQVGGIVLVIISTLAAALKAVVMSIMMDGLKDKPKLPATVGLFYDCALAFCMMVIIWLVSANERASSIDYFKTHPPMQGVLIILGGACMAFGFNLSNYYFIRTTSALTSSIGSNGVKIIILVISAIQEHIASAQNWCGVALACISIGVYTYFLSFYKPAPKPPMADMEAKGEATPLKAGGSPDSAAVCCVVM